MCTFANPRTAQKYIVSIAEDEEEFNTILLFSQEIFAVKSPASKVHIQKVYSKDPERTEELIMGMFDFKRCDGFVGSVPQKFIDTKFPKCPMCGTNEPYWKLKDKMEMMGNRTMFLCDKCGAILSATTADLSGFSKSKAGLLTTAGMINAIGKKASGKKTATTYIKVEEVGNAQTTKVYEGKEMPIEELQALAESL